MPLVPVPEDSTSLPVLLGNLRSQVTPEVEELPTAAVVRNMSLADFTPSYVAHWLNTVSSGIPSPVLADLKVHVLKHSIDGVAFQDILENCDFNLLKVEYLTPLHMTRLRKAWNLDHPKLGLPDDCS